MREILSFLLVMTFVPVLSPAAPVAQILPPIWRNDETPGDLGKVYYQTHEFCKAVQLDTIPLRVSEFSTSQTAKDADFENLRATDYFDSTGANIQSILPQGSLVLLQNDNLDAYRKVEVISKAFFSEADLLEHRKETGGAQPVAKVKEKGYLHKGSLEELHHYSLILRETKYTATARSMGLDLEDVSLRVSVSQEKINALDCCTGNRCEQFVVFNIDRPEDKPGPKQIAISPNIAGLLATATAQPAEEEEEPSEQKEENEEDPAPRTQQTGPAPIPTSRPDPGSLDGATPKSTVNTGGSIAGVPITGETADKVICVGSGRVSVRAVDGNGNITSKAQFKAGNGEQIRLRQSFDGTRKAYKSGGETYAMVEADFPGLKKRGWVAEQFVKSESACNDEKKKNEAAGQSSGGGSVLAGGVFPTLKRPSYSYLKGNASRWYGAGRSCRTVKKKRVCKRKHAACDLFRKQGDPARAILDGTVLQGPYSFYEGTWAVEVKHSNGKVVRYGEVSGKKAPGIKAGAKVKQGQIVGYIKRVNSGCCDPMLHFEMYTGKGRGALTQRGRSGFQRRSDLEDPTAALRKLEKSTFGKSW